MVFFVLSITIYSLTSVFADTPVVEMQEITKKGELNDLDWKHHADWIWEGEKELGRFSRPALQIYVEIPDGQISKLKSSQKLEIKKLSRSSFSIKLIKPYDVVEVVVSGSKGKEKVFNIIISLTLEYPIVMHPNCKELGMSLVDAKKEKSKISFIGVHCEETNRHLDWTFFLPDEVKSIQVKKSESFDFDKEKKLLFVRTEKSESTESSASGVIHLQGVDTDATFSLYEGIVTSSEKSGIDLSVGLFSGYHSNVNNLPKEDEEGSSFLDVTLNPVFFYYTSKISYLELSLTGNGTYYGKSSNLGGLYFTMIPANIFSFFEHSLKIRTDYTFTYAKSFSRINRSFSGSFSTIGSYPVSYSSNDVSFSARYLTKKSNSALEARYGAIRFTDPVDTSERYFITTYHYLQEIHSRVVFGPKLGLEKSSSDSEMSSFEGLSWGFYLTVKLTDFLLFDLSHEQKHRNFYNASRTDVIQTSLLGLRIPVSKLLFDFSVTRNRNLSLDSSYTYNSMIYNFGATLSL